MRRVVSLSLFLLSWLLLFSYAASKKAPATSARKEDIPYIKCQVCEKIAHQIHQQVQKKEAQISPKKVSELEIIETVENVCNLKKQEADWILQIDIVEKGDKLELVEQGVEGHCNSKCKTIERACQEVMGFADTDVGEFFYKKRPTINELVNYLCHDLSEACSVKTPPVPKDRIPGEPFVPKPSKDAEMEKMLRSMQDMPGAPNMKMYSRDDLMNNNFGDDDADEDEDDDDEDNFSNNLVFKNKETPKKDLKEKILEGVAEKSKQVKKHIGKASQKIKKWWRGFKKPVKKAPSKSSKSSKTEL
ncbi:Cell cycle protein GpsB [Rhynchospora pubera]|uniref:Cell cycle protein GpsB n=1 Tax=Rhynchospora pubera TaxID=906938 RepID=A0AAV8H7C0_9POAL|nr:Cell cycle protein GpsB [Rhynchospora pubera]